MNASTPPFSPQEHPPAAPALVLHLTQDADADAFLSRDPLALLLGMLLDQQIPMERAFTGPWRLAQRMGGETLDAGRIAAWPPDEFAALVSQPPAIHRFPASTAGRVQALCQHLVAEYAGDASAVWANATSGQELLGRLRALPGFGEQKARILLALLGKQLGIRPPGWREAAASYGDEDVHYSVADITGPESLARVRAHKQQARRAAVADKRPDEREHRQSRHSPPR
jgi:uncharacterized HhH-GPD family protein